MKLQDKVAVITGASMGIGEEIAKLFAREGAKLVLCSRDLARVEAARQRIGAGENAIAVACDVSRRDQVDALVHAAMTSFGRIDILINNAGFGLNDSLAELDMEQCRQLFETNLFGAMECMQAVIPIMRRQGGGDIVNVSSVAGHIATPYMSVYAASKHGMQAMGRAARMELQRHNINVLMVSPGYIATDFSKNMLKGKSGQRVAGSMKYSATAEVVANATLRGLLNRKREVVVPWFYWIAIKFYENFPGLFERLIRKALRPTSQVLAETAKTSSGSQ
jgi:uncharacterized protein